MPTVPLDVAAVLGTFLFEPGHILEADVFAHTSGLRGVIAGLRLMSFLATNSMAVTLVVAEITRNYPELATSPVPAQRI